MPFTYTCEQCGQRFTRKRRRREKHYFCSRKCYHEWTKQGRVFTCQTCGEQFYIPSGHANTHANKYCSSGCYQASRTPHVTKTCPECRRDFSVKAGVAHRYTHCSVACKCANTRYVECERCGKIFTGSARRRHCSEECRRPPYLTACKNCGKEFRHVPSRERQFCSFRCYRAYQGETIPEKKTRKALERLGIEFEQEFPVNRYSIDFMLVNHNIALEIDGTYWHQDPGKDKRRAKYIESKGYKVLHISDVDILSSEKPASLIYNIIKNYL